MKYGETFLSLFDNYKSKFISLVKEIKYCASSLKVTPVSYEICKDFSLPFYIYLFAVEYVEKIEGMDGEIFAAYFGEGSLIELLKIKDEERVDLYNFSSYEEKYGPLSKFDKYFILNYKNIENLFYKELKK